MNFTREPIIETIITPKEGNKLIVRNSKSGSQEEYAVDAVEVVSFGHSFFFRSLDRSKSFLFPVSDYELVEVKETRVALKAASVDRSIKIGGGREASLKVARESTYDKSADSAALSEPSVEAPAANVEQRSDKKRERRRHRRRRSQEERVETKESTDLGKAEEAKERISEMPLPEGGASEETPGSTSMFSRLFPPPPTLISEKLGKIKEKNVDSVERDVLAEPVEDVKKKKHEIKKEFIEENFEVTIERDEPDETGTSTTTEMQRTATNLMDRSFENPAFPNQRSSWMEFFSSKNPFKN